MQIDLAALVGIIALAAAAPIVADLVPRTAPPLVVVEIVLGILAGPSALDLVHVTPLADLLSQFGLAFLFFLAGFELEPERVRGAPARLAVTTWFASLALAFAIAAGLETAGVIVNWLFVGCALSTTALGTLTPILRDTGDLEGEFGAFVMAAGAVGELGPIVLIALLLTGSADRSLSVLLLALFALVAVAAAVAAPHLRPRRIVAVIEKTMEATGQLAVRLSVLVLAALVYLTSRLGLDVVLGAFSAGMLVSIAAGPASRRILQPKLDAVGFGVFVPIFFVVTGMRFDLDAVIGDSAGVAKLVLFLALLLVVRGLPTFVLSGRALPVRERRALALYASTGLPLIVAVTTLGIAAGEMRTDTSAGLVGAGMVSVLAYPLRAGVVRAAKL
ncbi:MAG TPA: cation:proton antiporter [Gaiellales bacterium]|nr:cation:proton antiporter [Gaiellales bacterium]